MSFTIVLYLVVCFFLVVFSLLQQNQSGGMGVLGGSSDTLLGTGQVSFLSKLVSFLAILYFVGSFFLNVISSSENPVIIPDILTNENQETSQEKANDGSSDNSGVSEALNEIVSNLPSSSSALDILEPTKSDQSSTIEEISPSDNQDNQVLDNTGPPAPPKE